MDSVNGNEISGIRLIPCYSFYSFFLCNPTVSGAVGRGGGLPSETLKSGSLERGESAGGAEEAV